MDRNTITGLVLIGLDSYCIFNHKQTYRRGYQKRKDELAKKEQVNRF